MLRRTQGHTIPAEQPTSPTCTSCSHVDTNLLQLNLAGFETPAWVCPDPTLCRRRAELLGVWKDPR